MRIVIVTDTVVPPTYGACVTILRFADGLTARGHDVRIVAYGAKGENDCPLEERKVPILTHVAHNNQMIFGKYDEGKIRAAFEGADIIHLALPFKLEKKAKKLADEMGIPTTAAFHVQPENVTYGGHIGWIGPLNHMIYRYYYRSHYKRFHAIHCPTEFIKDQLIKHGYTSEYYVISNGYDPAFRPPEQKKQNTKFEIAMTGRLSNDKRQRVLIKAVSRSAHKDDIHLTLYGRGPMLDKYKSLAKKLGVDLTIRSEYLDQNVLVERLGQSDLYVHTGAVEIEAIACLEAIACGVVPVISDSPSSATKQFALDERSLFSAKSPDDLSGKIDYWMENPEERLKCGKAYAEFALKFSISASLDAAESMFRNEIAYQNNARP